MAYCPFCGGKLDGSGKCPECGHDYGTSGSFNTEVNQNSSVFGTDNGNGEFTVSTLFKAVAVIAMLVIGSGSIIGLIAGAVLSTSKDYKYKAYGKCLLKLALILLIIKIVLIAILYLTVGLGSMFVIFNT